MALFGLRRDKGSASKSTPATSVIRAAGPQVVVQCTTQAEYSAALIDRDDVAEHWLPVYCPGACALQTLPASAAGHRRVSYSSTRSFASLQGREDEALFDAAEALQTRPPSQGVVVVDFRHDLAFVGAALALATRRRLHVVRRDEWRDLPEALQRLDASSALVVVPSTWLEEVGIDALVSQLTESHRRSVPFGVLTAPSAQALSWTVSRIAARKPRAFSARVLSGLQYFPRLERQDLSIWPVQELEKVSAERLCREEVALASFLGHGRPYCFHNGLLCSGDPNNPATPLQCVGDFKCIKVQLNPALPILRARELAADLVFLDSCLSAAFIKTSPARGHNVAIECLAGNATAVIAPLRLNWIYSEHTSFFIELLRRSATLGDAVLELNRFFADTLHTPTAFVLFGDPEQIPFAERAGPPTRLVGRATTSTEYVIELPFEDEALLTFECDDPALYRLFIEGTARVTAEAALAHVLHMCSRRRDDRRSVEITALLLDPSAARQPIAVTFTNAEPFPTDLLEAGRGVLAGCLRATGRTFCGSGEEEESDGDEESARLWALNQQLRDIEEVLAGTAGLRPGSMQASARARLLGLEPALANAAEESNTALVRELMESQQMGIGFEGHFGQLYGTGPIEETFSAEACPACGRALNRKVYRVGYVASVRRWYYSCTRCEILCDVEEGAPILTFSGPSVVSPGKWGCFTLRVVNNLTTRAFACAGVDVLSAPIRVDRFEIQTTMQQSVLEPGETWSPAFELNPYLSTLCHEYRLKGYVALNGRPRFANVLFQVRD